MDICQRSVRLLKHNILIFFIIVMTSQILLVKTYRWFLFLITSPVVSSLTLIYYQAPSSSHLPTPATSSHGPLSPIYFSFSRHNIFVAAPVTTSIPKQTAKEWKKTSSSNINRLLVLELVHIGKPSIRLSWRCSQKQN